jgi:hypothetical protein
MKTEAQIIRDNQAPPAYPGARPEFDGPQAPDLAAPPLTNEPPVQKDDRVERKGNFGVLTGEEGTVVAADTTQAVVKWDDDGRELVRQRYLKEL